MAGRPSPTPPPRVVVSAAVPIALALLLSSIAVGPGAAASTSVPGGTDVRVMSRPDGDGGGDDAFTAPERSRHHHDSAHFRLHWTSTTEDAAAIPFIKEAADVFEEVWDVLVDGMGWPPPVPDGDLGGSDLVDVYFVDLADEAYGYATADETSLCGACTDVHGYLVLDNDYAGFGPDEGSALRSTAAHEFSHLIQFGMAYDAEGWAYEATAVWLERVVFPEADARTQYLVDFAAHPELSLSDFGVASGGFDRAYGAYVWNVWLADRFGPSVVRDAWLAAAAVGEHLVEGYAVALRERGTLLERELVAFLAATAGWDAGGFPGEPIAYPPLARSGYLRAGDVTVLEVDHLAAHVADLDVHGPVVVTVRGPKFVAGGVALVAVGAGGVVTSIDDTLFDGQATVSLEETAGTTRVTLVLVNADPALAVPKPAGSDTPRYLFQDVRYTVGIDVDPGPPIKR